MHTLWGFLTVTLAMNLSPGPDDIVVLRNSLRSRRLGLATVWGVACAVLAWGVASGAGLSALRTTWFPAYHVIRLCGAGYLVALGAAFLLSHRPGVPRRGGGRHRAHSPDDLPRNGIWAAFSTGVVSDLLNPKIGVFYLAVFTQFIPAGAPVFAYSLLLCGIDLAVTVVWLSLLAWLGRFATRSLRGSGVAVWSQRCLGAALIGMAATVALPV